MTYTKRLCLHVFIFGLVTGLLNSRSIADAIPKYEATSALEPSELQNHQLFAHWPFDETSGTDANDVAGRLITQLQGDMNFSESSRPGVFGQALAFDGIDDEATTGALGTNLRKASFTAWVQFKQPLEDNPVLFGLGDNFMAKISHADHRFGGWYRDQLGSDSWTSNTCQPLVPDRWYHLGYTFESEHNRVQLFINGEKHLDFNNDLPLAYAPKDPIGIGGNPLNDGNNFHGAMDDVRVYSRIISEEEMKFLAGPNLTSLTPECEAKLLTGTQAAFDANLSDWGGDFTKPNLYKIFDETTQTEIKIISIEPLDHYRVSIQHEALTPDRVYRFDAWGRHLRYSPPPEYTQAMHATWFKDLSFEAVSHAGLFHIHDQNNQHLKPPFSLRLNGVFLPPRTGAYLFRLNHQGQVQLFVKGSSKLNDGDIHQKVKVSKEVHLKKNEEVPIRVDLEYLNEDSQFILETQLFDPDRFEVIQDHQLQSCIGQESKKNPVVKIVQSCAQANQITLHFQTPPDLTDANNPSNYQLTLLDELIIAPKTAMQKATPNAHQVVLSFEKVLMPDQVHALKALGQTLDFSTEIQEQSSNESRLLERCSR